MSAEFNQLRRKEAILEFHRQFPGVHIGEMRPFTGTSGEEEGLEVDFSIIASELSTGARSVDLLKQISHLTDRGIYLAYKDSATPQEEKITDISSKSSEQTRGRNRFSFRRPNPKRLLAVASVAAVTTISIAAQLFGRSADKSTAAPLEGITAPIRVDVSTLHPRNEAGKIVAGATPPDTNVYTDPYLVVGPNRVIAAIPVPLETVSSASPVVIAESPQPARIEQKEEVVAQPLLRPDRSDETFSHPSNPSSPSISSTNQPSMVSQNSETSPKPEPSPSKKAAQEIISQKIKFTKPGQTFWQSVNVSNVGEWEGSIKKSDYIIDVIVKLAAQNGHNLNKIQLDEEVILNEKLTPKQLLILEEAISINDPYYAYQLDLR